MSKTVPESLLYGLAAAALEPGLRQVLLFDADFEVLSTTVSILHQFLTVTTEREVAIVPLMGLTQEDDLWGSYVPTSPTTIDRDGDTGLTVAWRDGLLTQNRNDDRWLLIVIPDLTRLSLATARACITLMDAPVAYLERQGQHAPWQPRICWLAACDQNAVGKLSPHLLDRFALRLPAPLLRPESSATAILDWLNTSRLIEYFASSIPLLDTWYKKFTVHHLLPNISQIAIQRVVEYSQGLIHPGVRRELTLARLGRALARLAGDTSVSSQHIDHAASIIGLILPQPEKQSTDVKPSPFEPLAQLPETELPTSQSEIQSGEPSVSDTTLEVSPLINPDELAQLLPAELPLTDPYPEDNSPVDRELFTLQLPLRRQQETSSGRGIIIDSQPASSLEDLALVPTILEAALYQEIRHKNNLDTTNGFIFSPADLRRNRRVPQPEKMLLLLLDYTGLRDCDWQQSLIPHLRWAYVSRASITIIQVGSARAENELRAQRVSARSLLTPSIAEALEAQPGQATPLAHGLEIAHQVLQQAQQHGRATIQETRFVIITDGRGNVPLAASVSGQVKMPVNREGIEDAMQIAQHIQSMKRLEIFLLDPKPQYHTELPLNLAETLGAVLETILRIPEARV